jgi:outer membrane lipoprotein LolB
MERYYNYLILLVFFLAFGGCASLPTQTGDGSPAAREAWQARQDHLKGLKRWTLTGRMAVQNGREGGTGQLSWAQTEEAYNIQLRAPMGQGTFELAGHPAGVSLRTGRNQIVRAAAAEDLLQRQLGWSAPVSGLRYWLMGLPQPGLNVDKLQIDSAGRLTDLEQGGWRISVSQYRPYGRTELPSKISIENGRLKMRLAALDWRIGA